LNFCLETVNNVPAKTAFLICKFSILNKFAKTAKIFVVSKDKIAIFKQTELFRELDDDIVRLLARRAVEKTLNRNEILFLAGEEAAGLYVIAEGSVRAFRAGMDGREQVIHVERAVTTIAEVPVFDNGNYPSTAAAEEPTKVYFLEKSNVRAACLKHPQIALAATKLLAVRLRRCAELVESLSLREVGQRLALLLLTEAESNGVKTADGGVRFKQKLTHNQLAARIGTVREVVTRIFFRLQNQNLITVKGKEILIPNPEALAIYANSEKL
jgi:CRP-like cAMP-binding protein